MPHLLQAEAPRRADDCPNTWKTFFQLHWDALFQTALLLSADPDEAEATIAATLDTVDLCNPPAESELLILQEKLAKQTLQNARSWSASPKILEARRLLQDGLQPVLQIERFPRVCFILRMMLGCAASSCAQVLGIEEAAVRTLLRIAVLQLHHTVAGTSSRPTWLQEPLDLDGCDEHSAVRSLLAPAGAHC